MHIMSIKINVCGKIFETYKETLLKSDYLKHMMADCDDSSQIFINRSPSVFKHVLAYLIDDAYPYPKIYESELKFYLINYGKLYDPNWIEYAKCTNCQTWISVDQGAKCRNCNRCKYYLYDDEHEVYCRKQCAKGETHCPEHKNKLPLCRFSTCDQVCENLHHKYCLEHRRYEQNMYS